MLSVLAAALMQVATTATLPVTDPQWEPLPPATSIEILKHYPKQALERGVEGAAVVECRIAAGGVLAACATLQETPMNQGFGEAAAVVASLFRMKTTSLSGASVVGRVVRMPITFQMPWAGADITSQRSAFVVMGYAKWLKKPKGDDIARAYPMEAVRANAGGEGIVRCRVQPDGALSDCKVSEESPPQFHFGAAALRLTPFFKMDMTQGSGLVASGREIEIPIRFLLPH